MWSKEWEEECLKIHQAEVDELAANKKAEKAAFAVDIKPTIYVRGSKTDVCGLPVPKDCGLDIKPTVFPSKTKKTAATTKTKKTTAPAASVEKDEYPAPVRPALNRRPSMGRVTARRPSISRQRSQSRGRVAPRSSSRGRALSKSKGRIIHPDSDEEKPHLRNKSATKKKKKNANDGTKKKKNVKTPEPEPVPVETPLMRRRTRSVTRKQMYESGSEDDDRPTEWSDDAMSEDEIPPSRNNLRLHARRPSSMRGESDDKSKLIICDDSASETESPMHRRRSRSKIRQSSISEKDKPELQQRSISRHRRKSSESEDELGGSKRELVRRATMADVQGFKGSEQPAPVRLSRRISQQDGCEGRSGAKSITKRMISAKDFEAAYQSSDTATPERGRRSSRGIERCSSAKSKMQDRSFSPGRTVTEQVVLFDIGDEDEACTGSNLVPESPSSKKSNALTQHLQTLENAPGSAKMTPGKSKKRMVMIRSNSIGRSRSMAADGDDSCSNCEPSPMGSGSLKGPSHGITRQNSILRRKSRFAGKESIDCPDLNGSSKDWYNDSRSVVAV